MTAAASDTSASGLAVQQTASTTHIVDPHGGVGDSHHGLPAFSSTTILHLWMRSLNEWYTCSVERNCERQTTALTMTTTITVSTTANAKRLLRLACTTNGFQSVDGRCTAPGQHG